MSVQTDRSRLWIVAGLIGLGIVARVAPHPWNFTPVMAIALFGGTYLAKRWAILLPLAIVAASDWVIGWHATIPFTWGAFVLTGMLAWWIRQHPNPSRILAGSLMGSGLFFLITNIGVWLVAGLYPATAAGLWQCFVAAIPFFRQTVLGDLVYVTSFFGLYYLVMRTARVRSPIRVQ